MFKGQITQKDALEISSKHIGQPINTNEPYADVTNLVADQETAEPGEKVWEYTPKDDGQDDEILVYNNGNIVAEEIPTVGDVQVTFSSLNSKLYWMEYNKFVNSVDRRAFGTKKGSITRSMDKEEERRIIKAIQDDGSGLVKDVDADESGTTKDLYDVIKETKQEVEDLGDEYILLCGSAVSNAIGTYDKENASDFNYNVDLNGELKKMNITKKKVYGEVDTNTSPGDATSTKKLMGKNDAILLSVNSDDGRGKPVTLVRRLVNEEMADLMGVDTDDAQRSLFVNRMPVQDDSGNLKFGFGVAGIETIAMVVKNPRGIVRINNLDAIL